MKVPLTAKQVEQLRPYFDRIQAAARLGSPGMLVAQISYDNDWRYWLTPAFLGPEEAKLVTERGRDLPPSSGSTSTEKS